MGIRFGADKAATTNPVIGNAIPDSVYDQLPAWARTHIPVEPLVVDAPSPRGIAELPARKPLASAAVGTQTEELPIVVDEPEPTPQAWQHAERRSARVSKRGIATLAAGVLIAGASAMAGVALATPDAGQTVAVPTPPPSPTHTAPKNSLVADFCPDRTSGNTVTTSGPGSESTGHGVIAAFDYAYYTERDGQRVYELMTNAPNSAAVIQDAIDDVPDGMRACVTTKPTDDPLVFDVDVKLDNPSGTDGSLHQRITVAKSGTKFKIVIVEDR